jgi:hypothetical protein
LFQGIKGRAKIKERVHGQRGHDTRMRLVVADNGWQQLIAAASCNCIIGLCATP